MLFLSYTAQGAIFVLAGFVGYSMPALRALLFSTLCALGFWAGVRERQIDDDDPELAAIAARLAVRRGALIWLTGLLLGRLLAQL